MKWIRLLEITGFIIICGALVTFLYLTVNLGYSLNEIYYVYVIWLVGMILMFYMRFQRKKIEKEEKNE